MCPRNQFLFHLFYTTDEGNYNLWKIRHTESKQVVSLAKRISNKFFQYRQFHHQHPHAVATRSLQLPFVYIAMDFLSMAFTYSTCTVIHS